MHAADVCDAVQILGTVGEPINPEAWRWYNKVVGGGRCPIVDTWWQVPLLRHSLAPLFASDTMRSL
jgi:acetyl-CoA synthetase